MQSPSSTSGTVQKRENNKRSRRARRIDYSTCWTDLPQELLDIISNNLNVADYLSFGRVCRSWRSFYLEFSKQRFMISQSPLVLHISTRAKKACRFYDLTTGIRYETKLPKYICDFKFCLGVSSGYLIFMKDVLSSYIWLINPVTGHQVEFPPVPQSLKIGNSSCRDSPCAIFASIGSQNLDFLIVILSNRDEHLQFCTSRDNQWKVYSYSGKGWHILDVVVFDGRIFALTNDSQIGILNLRSSDLMFLKLKWAPFLGTYVRLVPSIEQLLIVGFHQIYRIDFSRMEWVKMNNLGDQALFTCNHDMICPKLISPTKWGGKNNCIYRLFFSDVCDLYSLDGEIIKTIPMPVEGRCAYPKICSWYFLHQSNCVDNVRDD